MNKLILSVLFFFVFGMKTMLSQTTTEMCGMAKEELHALEFATDQVKSDHFENSNKVLMPACIGNAANDNFVNAQLLVVNGGMVAGQTCGTQQVLERTACYAGSATLWYAFVATSSTHYVQVNYLAGLIVKPNWTFT